MTLIITMQDMRRVGFCPSGVETFFNRQGLDYVAFLREGIAAQTLLETGSVFARKCVTAAQQARDVETIIPADKVIEVK